MPTSKVTGALAGIPLILALQAQPALAFQLHDPDQLPDVEFVDPIERLQARIAAGQVRLVFDSARGYLSSLLDALDVPVSSQGLVFSRTSFQTDRISPWTPHALYFTDDVYVGFVQESPILEIASIDPDGGAVFYTLIQEDREVPGFQRETTACLGCHDSRSVTGGVPGVMVRSVLTDRFGYMVTPLHEGATSDRTPMGRRMGGWYVTGTSETAHSGNSMSPELSHEIYDARRYLREFDMTSQGKVADPSQRFDTEPYLSSHSDIVAQLVLAHQTRVHNLITLTHEAARTALRDQDAVLRSTGQSLPEGGLLPSARVRIDGAIVRLVREMFFVREAPLGGPIAGTSGFADDFAARGPVDSRGRSLRDFDLDSRLFRYPLSFLIYSDAFVALPDLVKVLLYERFRAVLEGDDRSKEFEHLSDADRSAIREILEETKPEYLTFRGGPR